MLQDLLTLKEAFSFWYNDSDFSMVDFDDFARGYLFGHGHELTAILEFVGSSEYEETLISWEEQLDQ